MSRVLIVDDHADNLEYLDALLSGHGYEVEAAHHGAEALVRAAATPPDLVVSDLLMPVMDGYTLLRHWKSDRRLARIPFVVYTATYTEPEDERLAFALGADGFILKPSEPEAFIDRIRAVEEAALAGEPPHASPAVEDEPDLLEVYSQTLIRKLEEKTFQLEETNARLEDEIAERRRMADTQRAILDALPADIALLDTDGVIRAANRSWRGFPGAAGLEGAGHGDGASYLDLCEQATGEGAEHAATTAREIRRVLSGELPRFDAEYPYRSSTDQQQWVRVVATPLGADRRAGAVVMHLDVTERRAIEAQFFRAQRMESLGMLAGGIAHDLNNVFTPIVMATELLRDDRSSELRRTMIDAIETSARMGAELVRQVLSFARGVEGRRVEIDLRELVGDVKRIADDTFLKAIRVRTSIEPGLPAIVGDPTQLHQVLLNLCVNARDAMPGGGTITIAAGRRTVTGTESSRPNVASGSFVAIEVADTGTGMPSELLERIFDPFYTTKEHGHGTGLGLSTSLAIVRSHGGFVDVDSTPGAGSSFTVCLPIGGDAATEPEVAEPLPVRLGNGELILVVDDEPAIRELTRQTLEASGYRVQLAADGYEAVSIFTRLQGEIGAVLTDMMMPGLDGAGTICALRRLDPAVRVVAVSGFPGRPEPGAEPTRHLAKPYSIDALLRVIDAALHGRL